MDNASTAVSTREVVVTSGGADLEGHLGLPSKAIGIVLFAHGSGSSRHSPRNNQVAEGLHQEGIATLLFDLLSEPEAQDRQNVFYIGLLAERLLGATDWVRDQEDIGSLPIGYFGASTGAAAALTAAARQDAEAIRAVVSRGGRPDLAEGLKDVHAPTLLIVGGKDTQVIELNEQALDKLQCEKEMEIVPNAGHLFEEPGALENVTKLARGWFRQHLPR